MIKRRKTPRPKALWTTTPSGMAKVQRDIAAKLKRKLKVPVTIIGKTTIVGKVSNDILFPVSQAHLIRSIGGQVMPFKPLQKSIPRISDNKMKSDRLYRDISKEFLALPENNFCRVHFALTGQKIQATCIHHVRGRHKTLKFDTRFFCPTATKNSLWPHQNIEKARGLGLIALAGEWNKEPDDADTQLIRDLMQEKGIK